MITAVSHLKSEPTIPQTINNLSFYLAQCLSDKHYDLSLIEPLLRDPQFAPFLLHKLVRLTPSPSTQLLESKITAALEKTLQNKHPLFNHPEIEIYFGTPDQNIQIDQSISRSKIEKDRSQPSRQFAGMGATPYFNITAQEKNLPKSIYQTPIAIIGSGVSGIMAARALIELGWNQDAITLFDKNRKYGGIWNFDFVAGLSRNNPRNLSFLNQTIPQAPGSGEKNAEFIYNLSSDYFNFLPELTHATVTSIIPGDLEHKVIYKEQGQLKEKTYPLVILAPGVGKPLPLSCKEKMTTPTTADKAGYRWQQQITKEKAESYRNSRLIFIGIGNSTGEMLTQLNEWNKRGYNIDYRVITHYPLDSIHHPTDVILQDKNEYRIFRDIKIPNLVDYAGDLEDLSNSYFSALNNDKIISDVINWRRTEKTIYLTLRNSQRKQVQFDHLFSLIGYGHSPEDMHQFGLTLDEQNPTIHYDYDGEFQSNTQTNTRTRLYPGYFGIGPILNCPENPNATVIPGNMARINDLLCGLVLRSMEYQTRIRN